MRNRSQRMWESMTNRILARVARSKGLDPFEALQHLDPAVFDRKTTTAAQRRLAINQACRDALEVRRG